MKMKTKQIKLSLNKNKNIYLNIWLRNKIKEAEAKAYYNVKYIY